MYLKSLAEQIKQTLHVHSKQSSKSSSYKPKVCFYQNNKEFLGESPLPANSSFAIPDSCCSKKITHEDTCT